MTITKIPAGYRFTKNPVQYTEADLAWFRRPLNNSK